MTLGLTLACAVGLALVHLGIGRLTFLDVVPRSRWLSAAGGISVAYVFLHLLPELAAQGGELARVTGMGAKRTETLVYACSLAGLVGFYGLERLARVSRRRSQARHGDDRVEAELFWLHLGSFALYNVIIGYLLLHREEAGPQWLATYFAAMAVHFVTNDFGLLQDHKDRYERAGRWVLAGSVLFGWVLGVSSDVPVIVLALLFAFLAGAVVLNVLKEELPEERQSRFLPFLGAATAMAALLIALT